MQFIQDSSVTTKSNNKLIKLNLIIQFDIILIKVQMELITSKNKLCKIKIKFQILCKLS